MGDNIVKAFDAGLRTVDEEQRLVEGYMGDSLVDIDGHMIDERAYIKAIEEFIPWGNIREMHGRPIGRVVSFGEKGWNHIVVKIVDDSAWNLVKEGVYKGFSIGARVIAKSWVDVEDVPDSKFYGIPETVMNAIKRLGKILRIDSMMLSEISLVDRPVNPRALILSYKGITGSDLAVDEAIILAQEESISKGEYIMGRTKTVVENLTEDAQPAELEKGVTAEDESVQIENISDSTPENLVTNVEEEVVAEVEVEKAVSESDAEARPENEQLDVDVVENSVQESEVVVFDAEVAIKALNDRIDEYATKLSQALDTMGELIDKAVRSSAESLAEKLSVIMAPVAEEVQQSEKVLGYDEPANDSLVEKSVMPTESLIQASESTLGIPSLNIEEIVQKAIDAAISKYVQVTSDDDERVGYVNKGDAVQEPDGPDFDAMSTDQKYHILAKLIANEAVTR